MMSLFSCSIFVCSRVFVCVQHFSFYRFMCGIVYYVIIVIVIVIVIIVIVLLLLLCYYLYGVCCVLWLSIVLVCFCLWFLLVS